MPKGKRKGVDLSEEKMVVRQRRRRVESRQPSDEEYDTGDTASVVSSVSDVASLMGDGLGEVAVNEEEDIQDDFEDKLKDCIEGCSAKSAKGRQDSLMGLRTALSKKYMYEFVLNRKMTLCDVLERCMKKGKGEEPGIAATAAVVLCLQLGAGDDSAEVYQTLAPILKVHIADNTANAKSRAMCAEAMGVMAFLTSDVNDSMGEMTLLENVFKASYLKGDDSAPSHPPQISSLHNSALMAWNLLLSVAPSHYVQAIAEQQLVKLSGLLESPDVDLRCTAGEAIALLYELVREEDEEFEGDDMYELCLKLKELATDSNKYRAKKDRRQQRSSFRDVLRAVEEGDAPCCQVRVGLMESIHISSWSTKRQYDSLCHILSTGMSIHLQENELVRDIFGLGAPIPLDAIPQQKISRSERHLYNSAAFKARTKARSRVRDKRAVAVHMHGP